MIDRYSTKEMKKIWSDGKKFERIWKVEKEFIHVMSQFNLVPHAFWEAIEDVQISISDVELEEISNHEARTKHDVLAFIAWLEEGLKNLNCETKWLHWGMTSSDALDTAMALAFKETGVEIDLALSEVLGSLEKLANANRNVPCVGRTHGQHAEPITFAIKVANWYSYIHRAAKRFEACLNNSTFGKISGPVGNYSEIPPEAEIVVLKNLGLNVEPVSTQVIPRDRYVDFVYGMAGITNAIEYVATEIRHLSRTEVGEVSEAFLVGQKGSSSMPHKKNPITSENLTGIARYVRSTLIPAMENIPLWHERDISHSSVERIILPDISNCVHYSLKRFKNLVENLKVDSERMKANLDFTRGLVYSGQALNKMNSSTREEAYQIVQKTAFEVMNNPEMDFRTRFQDLSGITIDSSSYSRHENTTLDRVFKL